MQVISLRHQLVYALLLFCLLVLLVPHEGYGSDVEFWVRWATYSFEHGLGNVYQLPDNNYNPVYHYILWTYGHGLGSAEKIKYYAGFLKAYTLVFDFAGAFWAASLVPERRRRFALVLLLLLNAGYVYNTLIWLQVDGLYTCFSFGAVVLAVQRRPVGSALLYVLALMAKTQAIMFLPVLGLLWVPQWWQRPRQLVATGLAAGALVLLLLAPFIWGGDHNYLPRILDINLHAAGKYPVVSIQAFNIWFLIASGELFKTSDALPFAGLTYHLWGLIWFGTAAAVALLPLLAAAWRALRSRGEVAANLPLVLLTCGVMPLVFTFFNTQMHERYWHPAVLFLAAYGFVRRDYLPFALVSVAYFLQLETVLGHLHLMNYTGLLFQPAFIATLFGTAILLVLVKIYQLAPWRVALQPAVALATT